MFATFLSEDMTYSQAIWDPEDKEDSLHRAQMRKLDMLIDSAHIKEFHHVLEFGSGWGSFAIRAVQRTGCRVTTVTLSKAQKEEAEERVRKARLEKKIHVLLCDWREIPVPEKPYDRFVSIEAVEHVGREYLGQFFRFVDQVLDPISGLFVTQMNIMPELVRHSPRQEVVSSGYAN